MKTVLVFLFLVGCASCLFQASTYTEGTCYEKTPGEPTIVFGLQDPEGVAWGSFNDTLPLIGFGSLSLTATDDDSIVDDIKLQCLGYLEGALTAPRISQHFNNFRVGVLNDFGVNGTDWPEKLVGYVVENMNYVIAKSIAQKSDPWWRQVYFVLVQMYAVLKGYNDFKTSDQPILNEIDWWILYSGGDLDDLTIILTKNIWPPPSSSSSHKPDFTLFPNEWHDTHHHCTGMVKLLPDYSDFFFSQDTWSSFSTLNRIMKSYTLSPSDPSTKIDTLRFSSYPGLILSPDDFWVLDNGLLVLETTMNNFNYTLYKQCHPEQVFTFIRVQVANRLSSNGDDWTRNFIRENSGTYNNQYYVLDRNKFVPFSKPESGFLWVIEQFPGTHRRADVTSDLIKNHHVISVNIPSFIELFNLAGYPDQIKACGNNYWTYWNCSRMQIALRDQEKIVDLETMKRFMRYNDWEHDPLSNGDSAEQILSRYDLRPKACKKLGNQNLCPAAFGGLDSKISNFKDSLTVSFNIISSPNWENQPPWDFETTQFPNIPHEGLPLKWEFDWQYFPQVQLSWTGGVDA